MIEAYDAVWAACFYNIDNANRRRANVATYDMSQDVPSGMLLGLSGRVMNHLRKLGYKVRYKRGTLEIRWDG